MEIKGNTLQEQEQEQEQERRECSFGFSYVDFYFNQRCIFFPVLYFPKNY